MVGIKASEKKIFSTLFLFPLPSRKERGKNKEKNFAKMACRFIIMIDIKILFMECERGILFWENYDKQHKTEGCFFCKISRAKRFPAC
jgi:hypothetical protein